MRWKRIRRQSASLVTCATASRGPWFIASANACRCSASASWPRSSAAWSGRNVRIDTTNRTGSYVVLASALVLATSAGVTQARGMTRLRQQAVRDPEDSVLATRVRHGALRAGVLRAMIAALSVALLALVARMIT